MVCVGLNMFVGKLSEFLVVKSIAVVLFIVFLIFKIIFVNILGIVGGIIILVIVCYFVVLSVRFFFLKDIGIVFIVFFEVCIIVGRIIIESVSVFDKMDYLNLSVIIKNVNLKSL